MKFLQIALIIALTLPQALFAEEAIRSVEISGAGRGGRFGDPVEITSVESLKKALPKAAIGEKHVDFTKESLLVFVWSGSGQDRVTGTMEKGQAVFLYKAGRTRDMRPHTQAFAVKKGTKWTVKRGS